MIIMNNYTKKNYEKYLQSLRDCEHPLIDESFALSFEEWKKSKKLKSDIKLRVYNTIFHKCNIKAFELEEDFNLPLHLRLPMIKTEEKA